MTRRISGARRAERRRVSGSQLAVRVTLYYLACWSVILVLAPHAVVGRAAAVLVAVASTIPLIVFFRRGGWSSYPTANFRRFVVRPVLYTQLVLPLVAGGGLLGLVAGAPFGAALLTGRVLASVTLLLMVLLLAVGYLGSHRLVVRQVDATIPGLPAQWNGLRIAQISDLHIGPQTSRRFLRRVADTINGLSPDLVSVTGDLVDDRAEDVPYLADVVGRLFAPLGVYLVPGNHDVYAGWADVARGLRASLPHAVVLVNDAHVLERDGALLAVAGTGDPAGRRLGDGVAPDIERTVRDIPPGTVTIALAHNPALWPALAARGVALTLSGHTHWGQLALPRWGWSIANLFLSRAMGAHAEGDALLYISPGTGYWGLPFRVGAHPEITMVRLRAGSGTAIHAGPATRGRSAHGRWRVPETRVSLAS
jgi:predicted MPP superfamily phosphohydrolase